MKSVSSHADPRLAEFIQNSANVPQSISKSLAYALKVPSSTLKGGGVGVGFSVGVGGLSLGVEIIGGSGVAVGARLPVGVGAGLLVGVGVGVRVGTGVGVAIGVGVGGKGAIVGGITDVETGATVAVGVGVGPGMGGTRRPGGVQAFANAGTTKRMTKIAFIVGCLSPG